VTVDTQPAAVAPVGTEPPAAGPRLLHIPLATFSAILAAVLAVASYFGPAAMIGAIAIVQAVLVVTWVFGTALPGRIGALILGVSASGAGDFVATRYHSDGYAPLLGVLGVGIPLMFVHQLTRGVVRTRVVESLADITVLVVACVATTGFILLRYQSNGDRTTLAVASAVGIALVVGHLADAVAPVLRFDPVVDRGLPAVILGVLAAAAAALLVLGSLIDFAAGRGAFVGAALGAVACLLSIGASFAGAQSTVGRAGQRSRLSRACRPFSEVALTICLTAPAGYVLINALSSNLS